MTAPERPGAAIEVVAIRHLDGSSSVKAFLDLQIGALLIRGAKIIAQDGKEPWLGMPAVKTDRAWLNTVEIISKELPQRVTEIAIEAWNRARKPQAAR